MSEELSDLDQSPIDQNPDSILTDPFYLRTCKYNGYTRIIFLHNPRKVPIPPPYVALYNYLVLTEFEDTRFPPNLEVEEMWKHPIQRRIFTLKAKLQLKDRMEALNMYTFEGPKINLIPIRTEGTQSFEAPLDGDSETKVLFLICRKLGIEVHHGCLDNPKDPENGEGHLTRFGLQCLSENIEEGHHALFFRDNHLTIVRKHRGSLFVLETNLDYRIVEGEWSPMWRTLNLSDSEGVFFTCRFIPVEMSLQPNAQEQSVVEFINKWNQDDAAIQKEQDDMSLFDSEGSKTHQTGKEKGSRKSRHRRKRDDKPADANIQRSTNEKLEESDGAEASPPCDDSGENVAGAEASAQRPDDEFEWIRKSAMEFFDEFKDLDDEMPDGDNTLPSFVRMVDALKAQPVGRRTNLVHINFPDIASHSPALAFAILNDRARVNKVLAEVFMNFRIKHKCGKKEQLMGKIKIRFHDMPSASSVQLFMVFLQSNRINLSELHTFYDRITVTSTTYWGRRAGKGYVDDILENHRNHKSWNGKFELSDMVIKNGKFQILKAAKEIATPATMREDLLKLIELLFDLYKLGSAGKDPKAPAYFNVFHQEVNGMISPDAPSLRAFQRYLSHHLAFKAPWVRSALFVEVWTVIQSLRRIISANGPHLTRAPFSKLNQRVKDFITGAKKSWEFEKVYGFNPRGEEKTLSRYLGGQLINFLEFVCNLDKHLLDHTRDKNGEQKVSDIIHVDLMIGEVYEYQAAQLVHQMMLDLTDAPFASSWRHYEMSESEPDNTDSESGKEESGVAGVDNSDSGSNIVIGSGNKEKVQLGGMDTSASGSGSK